MSETQARERVDRNIYLVKKTGKYLVAKYYNNDSYRESKREFITCETLQEAKDVRDKHEYETRFTGKRSKNTQITVAECLEEYIRVNPFAETTKMGYTVRLNRVRNVPLGNKKLVQVKERDIKRYLDYMQTSGQFKAKTINSDKQLLQAVMNYAVLEEYITENPCKHIRNREEEEFNGIALSKEEVRELRKKVEAYKNSRLKVIFALGLYQGLRRGEMAGLRWEDIFIEDGTPIMKIANTREPVKGEVIEKAPKTKHSRRELPVQGYTQNALDEYYGYLKERGQVGKYIILSERGQPIYPPQINNIFAKFLEQVDFRKMRLHDLRHTCCTLLIDKGMPIAHASNYLGHSSVRTTERVYYHAKGITMDEVAQKFKEIFND